MGRVEHGGLPEGVAFTPALHRLEGVDGVVFGGDEDDVVGAFARDRDVLTC